MIKIVTDSSCRLPQEVIRSLDITVVPLTFTIGDTIFVDDETSSLKQFIELAGHSEQLPKTSQPSIGTFLEIYRELCKDGNQVLSIHMSESLSGTVNAARQAAMLCNKMSLLLIVTSLTKR